MTEGLICIGYFTLGERLWVEESLVEKSKYRIKRERAYSKQIYIH